ncbi:zinc finger protein 701-like [Gigantopelta aegis]|uniref:zinc finger protein 701-like n=1 Tax=Gigantopelta aegis TaxID=1735272 RepID=UPI001B889F4D|nr:zinc finger protein 701-like [Gigantopelta aegis]
MVRIKTTGLYEFGSAFVDKSTVLANQIVAGLMEGKRMMEYGTPAKKQRFEYRCGDCGQTFVHKQSLNRHEKTARGSQMFKCRECDMTLSRRDNLERHRKKHVQQGGANHAIYGAKHEGEASV